MRINETLLDLATIYTNLSQSSTWLLVTNLKRSREVFHQTKLFLTIKDLTSQIETVDKQLYYLNKNIKTLEDALLCHETKQFEKRSILGGTHSIGLN